MANALPLLLIGAGAVLLLGGKKPQKRNGYQPRYTPPKATIPNIYGGMKLGEGPAGSRSSWADRHQALTILAGIRINLADGSSVPLCEPCDPGTTDNKPTNRTRQAVQAFQTLAGLDDTGEWGVAEDQAMHEILAAIQSGHALPCDPLQIYPHPFACFVDSEGDFYLAPIAGATGEEPALMAGSAPQPARAPISESDWTPDDIIVADPECEYIVHEGPEFLQEIKKLTISYALDGATGSAAANEIFEILMARHLPLCSTLGRSGVGSGIRQWWDNSVGRIVADLRTYEQLPDLLEEDAAQYGLL